MERMLNWRHPCPCDIWYYTYKTSYSFLLIRAPLRGNWTAKSFWDGHGTISGPSWDRPGTIWTSRDRPGTSRNRKNAFFADPSTRWRLVNVIKLKCYFLSKLLSKILRRWCVRKEIICSFHFCKLRTLTSTSRASTSILAFFSFAHFHSLLLS